MDIILYCFIGLFAGIVINYFADILPKYRKIIYPICINCNSKKDVCDYVLLKKCEVCGKKGFARNWIVYILLPIVSVLINIFPILDINYYFDIILITFFSIIFIIDIENKLILNSTIYFGVILLFFYGYILHGPKNTIIGGITGYLIMLLFFIFGIIFVKIINKRSDKEKVDEVALGFGDVNLAGILGLLLGWPGIAGGIFIAIFLGGIFSIGYLVINMIRRKYSHFSAIPYGPFLIIGTLLLFYF